MKQGSQSFRTEKYLSELQKSVFFRRFSFFSDGGKEKHLGEVRESKSRVVEGRLECFIFACLNFTFICQAKTFFISNRIVVMVPKASNSSKVVEGKLSRC